MRLPSVFAVELQDRCDVVERGELLQIWFVRHNADWVHAHRHPSVISREEDARSETVGPGTVWVRSTTLSLPRGTLLKRITTWPRPILSADPMLYLQREVRRVYRHQMDCYFRVTGSYCVEAAPHLNAQRPSELARPAASYRSLIAARERAALEHRRLAQRQQLEAWHHAALEKPCG